MIRKDFGKKFRFMLLEGNSLKALKKLPANLAHCGVTSPPYWIQRDYKHRDQLGQEKTPEEYIEKLVAVMGQVKRVLRKDGVFWLNIGDGYCKKTIKSSHLKQNDLVGIPWMLAFALRKDGWYIRSDVIWKKTNPQPESVKNRPSKSYEHIFLLSKTTRYFYDAEPLKEKQKEISIRRAFSVNKVEKRKDYDDPNYAISGEAQNKTYEKMRERIANLKEGETLTCNGRDMWEFSTANSRTKHFAIFPENLVLPCIQAGTSEVGCCPKCKLQWKRINNTDVLRLNWEPACDCGIKEASRSVVLDPFNGVGTTGKVCYNKNRNYIGVEINPTYVIYTRKALTKFDEMFGPEVTTPENLFH